MKDMLLNSEINIPPPPLKKERNKEREVNLNSESMAQSSTSEHIVYKNMRNKLSKNL